MDGNWTNPFPKNWKGENGVCSVGFSRQGLSGVSAEAGRVAEDIARQWRQGRIQPLKWGEGGANLK